MVKGKALRQLNDSFIPCNHPSEQQHAWSSVACRRLCSLVGLLVFGLWVWRVCLSRNAVDFLDQCSRWRMTSITQAVKTRIIMSQVDVDLLISQCTPHPNIQPRQTRPRGHHHELPFRTNSYLYQVLTKRKMLFDRQLAQEVENSLRMLEAVPCYRGQE